MATKKSKTKSTKKSNPASRPPIVVVIGHVDHGKTTLLDQIKKTNVAGKEAGGITQKIGAYEVELKRNEKTSRITFLDTPGHEAFSGMRRRGIKVADIAVLIVAADDGVQPQTVEAIKFAKESGIPMVVAFNKIDRPEADVARTKKQLADNGILTEDWGGQTLSAEISAKTGLGIEDLLDSILLMAEMEELKANPEEPAKGVVLESRADSKKGILATFLVKTGTLKMRDIVASGSALGKIKRMENFKGGIIKSAGPGTPAVVMGMETLPEPGMDFEVYKNPAEARKAVSAKLEEKGESAITSEISPESSAKPEGIYLNLIIKADSQGALEAIESILASLRIEGINLKIMKKGVGDINENDIKEASIGSSTIIGFNSSFPASLDEFAKQKKVRVATSEVIYKLVETVKDLAASLLPPKIIKTPTGKLQVIALFKSKKASGENFEAVFGAKVIDGKIINGSSIEIFHSGASAGKGKVVELQFNKEVAEEVAKPKNAGIHYKGNAKVELGDVLEAYTEEIVKQKIG